MAILLNTTRFTFPLFTPIKISQSPSSLSISCSISPSSSSSSRRNDNNNNESSKVPKPKKKLSEQSSWEAKDAEGNDYLYRLGKEADNMNIAVGASPGVIDPLFAGNFPGKDSDIVIDYRQKVTRSFEYLQGDYYIVPIFMDKVGIWGGKGQGKSFQTELIFQAMEIETVIMSAGELQSERAGEPGKLIRERYRTASQLVQNQVRGFSILTVDIWQDELSNDQ